jgi:crotonobetainyl-CoA:carnitine CoA-transferase CaiB-like acyl-CoA transferase
VDLCFPRCGVRVKGWTSLNGEYDGNPILSSLPVLDLSTGMNAMIAILAALRARDVLGKGQFVETTMYDTAIAALGSNTNLH